MRTRALRIRTSIPWRRDWKEATLRDAFLRLCDHEPRLLVLARVIERDKRARWFAVYRAHTLRLAAPLNKRLPDFCKRHACDIAEDFLHKLLIEHRGQRKLPVPSPKSALDRAALTCRLPAAPPALSPYEHTVAQLANATALD